MDMREIINLLEKSTYDRGGKIGRWAFLYMEPRSSSTKDFAQCGTCQLFMPGKERCGIFGKDDVVKAEASCGLYLQGQPRDDQPVQAIVTPEEAGYVEAKVRCENCGWFKDGKCGLFAMLDESFPDTFDLKSKVSPTGCCNAWN